MKWFASRRQKPAPPPTEIFTDKLEALNGLPPGVKGGFDADGHRFYFHDANSYYVSHQEILRDEIYRFRPRSGRPLVLDCGANMGVSVLFFARQYPASKIIAFEPEKEIHDVLVANMASFGLTNVEAHQKAVWDSETELAFTTDRGMGGSVTHAYAHQTPVMVKTVRLADYLREPVDLLKLDIEGAEYTVLKDCRPLLGNVHNLFVEYHSFLDREQRLDEILAMMKEAGFRYHLRQSFSRQRPFVDEQLICENMDMAITVFGYR